MLDGRRLRALDESQPDALEHLGCYCVRWTCVRTHPQAERWADSNLRHSGYQTYLPLLAIQRADRVVPSMQHTVLVPLFAGYVFVQHDPNTSWGPIRDAPGVHSVLRCGNLIQYARNGDVEALQAGDATRRTVVAPSAPYAAGEAVSVRTGALAGHQGVVISTTPSHAVVALILLGGLRRVTVRLDALTRPAA